MRHARYALILAALLACLCTMARAADEKPLHVLFVGNSLTYVNNLPAVLEALSAGNGKSLQADMLVKGGATLTQWLQSGAVQKALQARHYDYVVLQERSNDFACGFGPEACADARHALRALAGIVRHHDAQPMLMGTYQVSPAASATLVAAEAKAAQTDSMPYLDVSSRLNQGRARIPYADWFAKAGHPGHDLALLEATLLYRQLFDTLPQATPLTVRAPMFVPGSKFAPPDPVSTPLLPDIPLAGGYEYSRGQMTLAMDLVQ